MFGCTTSFITRSEVVSVKVGNMIEDSMFPMPISGNDLCCLHSWAPSPVRPTCRTIHSKPSCYGSLVPNVVNSQFLLQDMSDGNAFIMATAYTRE